MISPTRSYSQEYSEIKKTRFWNDYCDKLATIRGKILKRLLDPDTELERQYTYANLLRDTHRLLGQIEDIPLVMAREESNGKSA